MSFNNGRYTLTKTGTMIPDAEGAWRKQGDVEALQRERDEAIERAEQCRKDRAMVLTVKTTDGLTASEWLMRTAVAEQKAKDLQTALDAEREKVKGLHEATKVICGHCCESMEIPSKAALQSHLSTLQGLMETIKCELFDRYDGAPDSPTRWMGSLIRDIEIAQALPATPTAGDHSADLNKMVQPETIATVTAWANETFGEAMIHRQVERARDEFDELNRLMETCCSAETIAEEAADVCICLYRVIGTLDPEAINKKMAKNRARKWKVDGQGCAQHVGDEQSHESL